MNPPATRFFRACRVRTSPVLRRCQSTSSAVQQPRTRSAPRDPSSSRSPPERVEQSRRYNSTVSEEHTQKSSSQAAPIDLTTNIPSRATETSSSEPSFLHTGHVTAVGRMRRTVRAERTIQVWNKHLQKYYKHSTHDLVHDPQDILNEGDVITYWPFTPEQRAEREKAGKIGRKSLVKYVLKEVTTPFGSRVEDRVSRVVGSPAGRWTGGPGEVKKLAIRARDKKKTAAKGKEPNTA